MPAGDGAVRHLVGNQLTIRNDQLRVVAEGDQTRPDADSPNNSCDASDLDNIADLHWPLEEENQAGEEIVEDVLQTEADADTEGTGEDGKLRHVGAERSDRRVKPEEQNDVVRESGERVGRTTRDVQPIVDFLLEKKAQEAREEQRYPDGKNKGEHRA